MILQGKFLRTTSNFDITKVISKRKPTCHPKQIKMVTKIKATFPTKFSLCITGLASYDTHQRYALFA